MTTSRSIVLFLVMAVSGGMAAEADSDTWEFSIAPYLWGVGIDGTVGVGDLSTDADVSVSRILETLEMGAMLSLEARKGRWGVLADGVYMRISDDTATPGPFFNTIKTTIENGTLDLALAYRVIQSDRGWVDVLAGARYVYASAELDMTPDYEAVGEISAAVMDQVVSVARGAVESGMTDVADEMANELAELRGDVGEAARNKINNEFKNRIDEAADRVEQRVDEIMDRIESIPPLQRDLLRTIIEEKLDSITDAQREAIADAVKAAINSRGDEIKGQAGALRDEIVTAAQARVSELKKTASSKVNNALTKAEQELARAIEEGMKKVAAADIEGSREWVDPYLGVRGRLNLTESTYVGARTDIGGFGVGSDLMVHAFGGMGYSPRDYIEIEAGWRYLLVDYDKDNFVYDVEYSGAVLGVRFKL